VILRLSELFEPKPGDKKGQCVVCGCTTEKGHKIDFSNNFTAWPDLQAGNVICEYCYALVRDQQYRRKSWVVSKEGVKFLKKDEILDVLLNPPEPPFGIYITKSGKKQGFLKIINRVNYSRKHYFIAFEDNLIYVDVELLKRMVEVAKTARSLKFSKTELLQGARTYHWEHEELCGSIEELKNMPLWEVVVFAIK